MKLKLAITCLAIGTAVTPIAVYATDSDTDRSNPEAFVKDSVITTKIKTKLATDHPGSAKHIRVDTDKNGDVWMSGTANSQDEIDQAVAIARHTDGVKSVHSNLKVQKDR